MCDVLLPRGFILLLYFLEFILSLFYEAFPKRVSLNPVLSSPQTIYGRCGFLLSNNLLTRNLRCSACARRGLSRQTGLVS